MGRFLDKNVAASNYFTMCEMALLKLQTTQVFKLHTQIELQILSTNYLYA